MRSSRITKGKSTRSNAWWSNWRGRSCRTWLMGVIATPYNPSWTNTLTSNRYSTYRIDVYLFLLRRSTQFNASDHLRELVVDEPDGRAAGRCVVEGLDCEHQSDAQWDWKSGQGGATEGQLLSTNISIGFYYHKIYIKFSSLKEEFSRSK